MHLKNGGKENCFLGLAFKSAGKKITGLHFYAPKKF